MGDLWIQRWLHPLPKSSKLRKTGCLGGVRRKPSAWEFLSASLLFIFTPSQTSKSLQTFCDFVHSAEEIGKELNFVPPSKL